LPCFSMLQPFGSALADGMKPEESRGMSFLRGCEGMWVGIRLGRGNAWTTPPPLWDPQALESLSRPDAGAAGLVVAVALLGRTRLRAEAAQEAGGNDALAARVGLLFESIGEFVTEVRAVRRLATPIDAGSGHNWSGLCYVEAPRAAWGPLPAVPPPAWSPGARLPPCTPRAPGADASAASAGGVGRGTDPSPPSRRTRARAGGAAASGEATAGASVLGLLTTQAVGPCAAAVAPGVFVAGSLHCQTKRLMRTLIMRHPLIMKLMRFISRRYQ
jgi:hypothetical protein